MSFFFQNNTGTIYMCLRTICIFAHFFVDTEKFWPRCYNSLALLYSTPWLGYRNNSGIMLTFYDILARETCYFKGSAILNNITKKPNSLVSWRRNPILWYQREENPLFDTKNIRNPNAWYHREETSLFDTMKKTQHLVS